MMIAIGGTLIAAVTNSLSFEIPYRGFLLGMTRSEWFVLLWLALAPIALGKTAIPMRWWLYFGMLSFVLMYFLTPFAGFIQTVYHSGRRPGVQSDFWRVKLLLFLTYFVVAPVLADAIKKWVRRQNPAPL